MDFTFSPKELKPRLLGPETFGWVGVLPREGMGAKKVRHVLRKKPRETKLFGGISRDFCQDIPGVPEKFAKRKFVFNSRPPMLCVLMGSFGRTLVSLDQVSAIQGKFYMQRFPNTSFGRTLLCSSFAGLFLEQIIAWHSAAFPLWGGACRGHVSQCKRRLSP